MIAGLVLAAGRGTRFGGGKLAAVLADRAVVRWSVDAVQPAVDHMVVVVAAQADDVRAALAGAPVTFVVNAERDEGMASSLRAGVSALPDEIEAVVVALGDQPFVGTRVVEQLCERWWRGDCAAVVAEYRDGRGHPVLFGRECVAALMEIEGDVGARAVLASLGARVATVAVDSDIPLDVDTWAALERLRGSLG